MKKAICLLLLSTAAAFAQTGREVLASRASGLLIWPKNFFETNGIVPLNANLVGWGVISTGALSLKLETNANRLTPEGGSLTNDGVIYADRIVLSGTSGSRAVDYSANTNEYEDLVFSITTLNPPGTESAATLVASSGPSADQLALVFVANNVFLVAPQMSHTWVPGTTIFPHIHVMPQTAGALTNRWRVAYSVADIGEAFPPSTVVTNDVVVTAGGEQWVHKLVNVPTNGIPMTGKTGPSTEVMLRYTLLAESSDTHVISFDIHYRSGGSPVVYVP